jgi:hypothetical protein
LDQGQLVLNATQIFVEIQLQSNFLHGGINQLAANCLERYSGEKLPSYYHSWMGWDVTK